MLDGVEILSTAATFERQHYPASRYPKGTKSQLDFFSQTKSFQPIQTSNKVLKQKQINNEK